MVGDTGKLNRRGARTARFVLILAATPVSIHDVARIIMLFENLSLVCLKTAVTAFALGIMYRVAGFA
jgi:hypothetical protein